MKLSVMSWIGLGYSEFGSGVGVILMENNGSVRLLVTGNRETGRRKGSKKGAMEHEA